MEEYIARTVDVVKTRKRLAKLLDPVEAGDEAVILRRDRPVARQVPISRPTAPLDRSALRIEVPPMTKPAEQVVRELRNEE